jgi:hypothetical protein
MSNLYLENGTWVLYNQGKFVMKASNEEEILKRMMNLEGYSWHICVGKVPRIHEMGSIDNYEWCIDEDPLED